MIEENVLYIKEISEPFRAQVNYYGRIIPCCVYAIWFEKPELYGDDGRFMVRFDAPVTISGVGGWTTSTYITNEIITENGTVRSLDYIADSLKEVSQINSLLV